VAVDTYTIDGCRLMDVLPEKKRPVRKLGGECRRRHQDSGGGKDPHFTSSGSIKPSTAWPSQKNPLAGAPKGSREPRPELCPKGDFAIFG
jgi:hypothetical protein